MSLLNQLSNEDLTKVDISYTLLAAGIYTFKVASITEEPAASGNGDNLKIKLILEQNNVTDTKGKVVNLGFPIIDNLYFPHAGSLDRNGKPLTSEMSLKRLAVFTEACGGRSKAFKPDDYIGKTVLAKIKLRSYKDKDGNDVETNEVSGYIVA